MQSSYLLLNGLRVHYLHWRRPGEGRPVVLLHGLAANARLWQLVAQHLVEHDLAPLVPDARGHGLTDKPDGDYGFNTFSRDLAAFIDACQLERPLLVGHSWGAWVALDFAARFPFGPYAPSGVVLVDGGMTQLDQAPEGYPQPTWEAVSERMALPRLAGMPLAEFIERISQSQHGWQPEDEIIPLVLANVEVSVPSLDEAASVRGNGTVKNEPGETVTPRLTHARHQQILRALWEFQTFERFGRVGCPVLMLPCRPPAPLSALEAESLGAKEWGVAVARQKIARLQVHWLEDSIHDVHLQRPAEVARLIAAFAAQVATA